MKLKRGSTSVRRVIFIADSSSTTGAGLANLLYDSSGLVAYYYAGDLSNEVQITLATATLGSYTSGGFIAVDNTNMPGWYEIGIPDAALDAGNEVCIQLRGATNMVPVNIYIELDAVDYQTDAFGALKPTTAGRTLDVTAGGNAGIDWGNVENPTATLNLSDTTVKTAADIATLIGVAGAGLTEAGGTGDHLTAVPWNASWDAEAQSEVADALTAFAWSGITISAVSGSVGSVTGAVTVGTINSNVITAASIAADTGVELATSVWDRVLTGATHNIVNSAGRRLRQVDAAAVVDAGTAQAGGATSITLATTASSTNDIYNGDRVEIVAGTGAGENAIITDYDGTTKVATVTPAFVITPDATSEYQIVPATSTVVSWNGVAVTGNGDWAGLVTLVQDIPTTAEFEARTIAAANYATAAAVTAAPAQVITLLGSGTEVYGHSYLEAIKRIEVVAGAATLSGAGTGTEVMTSSDSSKTATFTVDGSGNVSAVVWS